MSEQKKIVARMSEKKEIGISVAASSDESKIYFSSPRSENGHFVFDIFVPMTAVVRFCRKDRGNALTNTERTS